MDKLTKLARRFAHHQWVLVKRVFELIKTNFLPLFAFLTISAILNLFVAYVMVEVATMFVLKMTGMEYLCMENLFQAILSPAGIFCLIVVALSISSLAIFQVGGVVHASFMALADKRVTLRAMCAHGFETTKRSLTSTDILIIPFMLMMFPFTGFVCFSTGLIYIIIPEFIQDAINANNLYHMLLLAVMCILFIVAFFHIYAIPEFIIERKPFVKSLVSARTNFKRHFLLTPISMLVTNAVFYLLCVGFAAILASIIVKVGAFLFSLGGVTQQSMTSTYIFNIIAWCYAVLSPAVSMGTLTALYKMSGYCDITIAEYEDSIKDVRMNAPKYAAIALLMIACLTCCTVFKIGTIYTLNYEDNVWPDVVAHRGDSIRAPENTEPAFQSAIDRGEASWIELDVHQTKDDVIIVSHDENLKRVSGKDINVRDITYAELQQLDTGSWFSEEFSYVRCMTLDDALKMMKGHVKVQIELKPTGNENDLEGHVIDVIKANDMVEDVTIICLESAPLIRVKEIDPQIHTAYCMALAWSSIENASFADDFSIEEGNITAQLVQNIHKAGKKVFAWTCNSEDNVQYLVDCGVDGIVTDDAAMIENTLGKVRYNGGIPRILRIILDEMVSGI